MRPYFVVFVWIILQHELRTPGVIPLCHKMTLHMSVREPLYDVNKTLTEAFHYIIMQLSFHNPNTDIVLQWTQPEICVTSWEVSPSTTQGFSKCMHSISMKPYCMVCGSHFPTWGKQSQSYFFISYTHSPYACVGLIEQREISTPRVISLYHIITPHKSVWGHRTTWNEHPQSYFIVIWYMCHRCHRFPWPTENIMQLKKRASGVMSLYNRISLHGSE